MSEQPEPTKRRWTRVALAVAKWTLFVAVLVFVGRAVVDRFGEVAWAEVHVHPGWAAAGIAAMLVAAGVPFLAYHLVLRRLGPCVPWPGVMADVWTGQIAKYVPGKVGSVVGIAYLLHQRGVPARLSVGAIVMVAGLLTILGLMIAVPLTLWEPVRQALPMAWLWCSVLIAAGLVCLHPRVFGALWSFALRKLGQPPFETLPRVRDLAGPTAALVGHFGVGGLALWFLARTFSDIGPEALPLMVAANALALVAGFLSVFAPAGFGVYEGVLLILLGPFIGEGHTAILVVAKRLVQTLSELALAGAGLALARLARRRPQEPEVTGPPANPAA
ncbi:MAG: flippase-like domain-containing protein [Planctomycetes bacterium]|nr:flippase-like domain-containing protein [Planctomycetota bacterium]